MSVISRCGSLSFEVDKNKRGCIESNLYGGYRESGARTPEISVIALDFRRHSQDLKKNLPIPAVVPDLSEDENSDELSSLIGHFGRWQLLWTTLLCIFQVTSTLHIFSAVFQTAEKDFWCARPEEAKYIDVNTWRNLTQPDGPCTLTYQNVTSTCTKFEFSKANGVGQTIPEEFGLICGKKTLLSVVEMCFLAGAAIGSVTSGWVSDRFGRKHTLMIFALVQSVFGTILAYSTSLAMYMTIRVIIGFASMTVVVVSFVLVVELVSGKWRTIIGILNILPVALTYVFCAGIAYLVPDWRTMQLIISAPWLTLLLMWFCLPESPRWLLARGRLPQLYSILERAAKMNGITLPANYQKSLEAVAPATASSTTTIIAKTPTTTIQVTSPTPTASTQTLPFDVNAHHNSRNVVATATQVQTPTGGVGDNISIASKPPYVVVFSEPYLRTTTLLLVVWLSLVILYFGLTLHLNNLGGDIYVNTAIAGFIEAISIVCSIFVVLKMGIRQNLIGYMLVSGICCLGTNLVPQGEYNTTFVLTLAMIAKCLIGATNAIIPTYTALQYPTIVRNFGVSMGNLASAVGLILVPYVWLLEHVEPLLPMTIMGISGIIGSVAVYLIKETNLTN